MTINPQRAQSLEHALIAAVTRWNIANGAPAGADLLLSVLIQSAAKLVAGCPVIADRTQLASDALELFTMDCGVDPIAVMRYRIEHRQHAIGGDTPVGRA